MKQNDSLAQNKQITTNTGEIILYQPDNNVRLEVLIQKETVWLTQQQMAFLYGVDRSVIVKHIGNIYKSDELQESATCAKIAQVQQEGGRNVLRKVNFYSLDMIISVGYRVNSINATRFRQWANSVLKNYLLHGYAINQRFERLEQRVCKTEEKIDFFVHIALPPIEGIFFDGQIFDAYTFASDLIRSARERIILIDNYVDDSVLKMLTKRNDGVSATIITRKISDALAVDHERHNQQYPPVNIQTSDRYHDRFLILDDTVYHLGASLKDLGKKLFAFSKLNIPADIIL
ncbi:MAG: virulence RhuM family protein [Bacteroidales bacterium]|nr:virulence RhuM family protein [Bacteroidales bacterium]